MLAPFAVFIYGAALVQGSWSALVGFGILLWPLTTISRWLRRLRGGVGALGIMASITSLLGVLGITTGGSSLGSFLGGALGVIAIGLWIRLWRYSSPGLTPVAIAAFGILVGIAGLIIAGVTRGHIWV